MPQDTKLVNKLRLAIELLASDERDSHMSAAEIRVFLYCVIQPGITMKDLARYVGVAQSEISRTVARFSQYNENGFGLLTSEEDPQERRRKIVHLTPRGERLAEQLAEILK